MPTTNDVGLTGLPQYEISSLQQRGLVLEGIVLLLTPQNLVMNSPDGKVWSRALASNIKLACGTKDCELTAIMPGSRVRVTTASSGKHLVVKIDCLDVTDCLKLSPHHKSPRT